MSFSAINWAECCTRNTFKEGECFMFVTSCHTSLSHNIPRSYRRRPPHTFPILLFVKIPIAGSVILETNLRTKNGIAQEFRGTWDLFISRALPPASKYSVFSLYRPLRNCIPRCYTYESVHYMKFLKT